MPKIAQDALVFEVEGISFSLQFQSTLFTTEIELWEYNEAVNDWYYVFDEDGKRKPIFMGASQGTSSTGSPMPDGTTATVTFSEMVEAWGGAKAFIRDYVLVEANKRLARRFPDAETEPTVPAEVEGTMYDRCIAILNSQVEVVDKRLVMVG